MCDALHRFQPLLPLAPLLIGGSAFGDTDSLSADEQAEDGLRSERRAAALQTFALAERLCAQDLRPEPPMLQQQRVRPREQEQTAEGSAAKKAKAD